VNTATTAMLDAGRQKEAVTTTHDHAMELAK
jgi:hypothetical protein